MLVLDHNPALCAIRQRRDTPDYDPAKALQTRSAIQRLCWITIQHSAPSGGAATRRITIRRKRYRRGLPFNATRRIMIRRKQTQEKEVIYDNPVAT